MFEFTQQQRQRLEIFAGFLQEENKKFNLTRITETDQIWLKHFQDSLACVDILREMITKRGKITMADVGSGAGFPGLVIAAVLDDCQVVSIESTGKKCGFQEEAIKRMGLKNVEVINGRAEDLSRDPDFRERFDIVMARAVGELAILAEISFGLLKVGGVFISWKGPKVEQELQAGRFIITKLGGGDIEQIKYTLGDGGEDYRLIKVKKIDKTPKKYPMPYKDIVNRIKGKE